MSDTSRAQLIHIDVDRRLGHEWDEWDGKPLPNRGNYDASPTLFFLWSAVAMVAALLLVAIALSLFGPRLGELHRSLPTVLWWGLAVLAGILWLWWGVLLLSFVTRRALLRGRKVGKGELLLLIPRCLSKETLDGVLGIAGRYGVPVFVATRGQLARRVIRERRPRAVVAVACERDMVSGLHDVAGKIPVLGLTMTLPSGPCKDALLDLRQLEDWVRAYVV
jgi:hypothetical protein